MHFTCLVCGENHLLSELLRCPDCGGELIIDYDYDAIASRATFQARWRQKGSMWERFSELLPQDNVAAIVSLGEGNTPLLRAKRFADYLGLKELYFKLESSNPTGSFKDRQVAVAISKANELGGKGFATVSSGNVGVALSAYSARVGAKAYVWVSGETADAKRQQIQIYGAQLLLLPDPREGGENVAAYHEAFVGMGDFCLEHRLVPMISARSVNPYMVEGAKTMAYEIAAELGGAPDRVFAPVGGGGLLGGIWQGFKDLDALELVRTRPRIDGAQKGGYFVPIDALEDPVYATSRYYRPLDGAWAWESIQDSLGHLWQVDDRGVHEAQAKLAGLEGVFAEPRGAYATAGLLAASRSGELEAEERVVCIVSGLGLKDMEAVTSILGVSGFPKPKRVASLRDSEVFGEDEL